MMVAMVVMERGRGMASGAASESIREQGAPGCWIDGHSAGPCHRITTPFLNHPASATCMSMPGTASSMSSPTFLLGDM